MKDGLPNRFELPETSVRWVAKCRLEDAQVHAHDKTADNPHSVSMRRASDSEPSVEMVRIWAARKKNGVHYTVIVECPNPMSLRLVFDPSANESRTYATAAMVTAMAALYYEPPARDLTEWMKLVYGKVLVEVRQKGESATRGLGGPFQNFLREGLRLIDRASGTDVADALSKLRQDFRFLSDHVEEEQIVMAWRETLITKVHDR